MLRLALLLGVLAGPAWTAAHAAQSKPWRIYMMLFRGCEDACRGFQDYFRQQGVAVEFILRDAAQDRSKVPQFVAEARRLRPDLVLTWGTSVTQDAVGPWNAPDPRRHLTDLPVVFMIVSDPVASGIVPSLQASGRNVTGSLYLLPLDTQLQAARSYFAFRKLGYLVNPTEPNSLQTRAELSAAAARFGYTLVQRQLPLSDSGLPRAEAIPALLDEMQHEGVDLLYQGPDTFLVTRRDLLTAAALARGLPVFAASELPVLRAQALFGVVNKYENVGRYTAALALRLLRGQARPAQQPIELPRHFSYLVNMPVALELGRYPPLKLLDVAELVGMPASAQ